MTSSVTTPISIEEIRAIISDIFLKKKIYDNIVYFDKDDVISECWLMIYENFLKKQKMPKNISNYGLVKRRFVDVCRNIYGRDGGRASLYNIDYDINIDEIIYNANIFLDNIIFSNEIWEYLENILPYKEYMLLKLKYDDGYSFKEIAKELKTTENYIGQIHHRIMKKLRNDKVFLEKFGK